MIKPTFLWVKPERLHDGEFASFEFMAQEAKEMSLTKRWRDLE